MRTPTALARLTRIAGACGLALLAWANARAYVVRTDDSGVYVITWLVTPISMQVKLPSDANLIDGNSQSTSLVASMQNWNSRLGTVQFAWQTLAPGAYSNGNGVNELVMDSTIDGDAFSTGTLAVTITYSTGDTALESDIVFNNTYTWDSYRGNVRSGRIDIQRVATHELGHVLGLMHPDEHDQAVVALMNSHVSNIDALQADDLAGAQLLYGAPGTLPANDNFTSATPISLLTGSRELKGSNLAATRQPGEPNHAGSEGRHSIWWKWTAAVAGTATATTLGSDFDTALGVYTGGAVGVLTQVAANDDEETPAQNSTPSRKRTSKLTFNAVAGQTYYLAVDGWGDSDMPGNGYVGAVTLNLSMVSDAPVPLARLANISTRAYCSTGDNVTIGGFVITGNGPKRVLVRAVGPSLTTQGLTETDVLRDPMVEVHHGAPIIASNDNWGDNANLAEITAAAQQVGAFALANGDTTSSVLLLTLDPGVYSFIVKGKNDASGIVLLEVYDADPAGSGAKFFDIAARGYATTGDRVAIGGFVITGNRSKRVLIRAVGPTLTSQGLTADKVLTNPRIELHHGLATIAQNDNWTDATNAAEIMSTGSRVGALPFDNTDSTSSALLLDLDPGAYSFIAQGVLGTSGIVLIEVYDAD